MASRFLVPCCNVLDDFRVKVVSGSSSLPCICFVWGSYLYLYLRILRSKHDFHIRWYSCRLTVTHLVSLVEHELLTLPEHLVYSRFLVGLRRAPSLVYCVVFCRALFVIFLAIVLSVFVLDDLRFLITPLVCTNFSYRSSRVYMCD